MSGGRDKRDRDDEPEDTLPVIDSSHDCERCRAQSEEFYDVPGRCLNCGTRFTVRSRKGDRPPSGVECPHCEVTDYSWRVSA